tara:strand:+ start:271 stop:489 length:219 start_codon:yes stop_codon:yes gene_type:complete
MSSTNNLNGEQTMTITDNTIENIVKLTSHIMKTEYVPKRQAMEIADKAVSALGYSVAMSEYNGKFFDSWSAA